VDLNCYALELVVESRLSERRAEAALHALLAPLRTESPSVLAAVTSALIRAARRISRRGIVSPRPA